MIATRTESVLTKETFPTTRRKWTENALADRKRTDRRTDFHNFTHKLVARDRSICDWLSTMKLVQIRTADPSSKDADNDIPLVPNLWIVQTRLVTDNLLAMKYECFHLRRDFRFIGLLCDARIPYTGLDCELNQLR